MLTFFRVCCLLSCCLAGVMLFWGLLFAASAPQEAGTAAIAIGLAVIPYVFTRMIEALDAADDAKDGRKADPASK